MKKSMFPAQFFPLSLAFLSLAGAAHAADYTIDPSHTYPAFEADHMGGVSKWRGKINKSEGTVSYDAAAKTGKVDVTMQMATIDFGFPKMNEHAIGPDIFDTAKYPTARFVSDRFVFDGNKLVSIPGQLTLKGVTKPVTLKVNEFLCKPHPFAKREVCGADAETVINRGDFGVDYGLAMGFKPEVKLLISVEAIKNP
ncbi:YceI family protein [Limnobacter humi]|uniref:YceI family protein n=1 Tax=Limnobacter humi TaxID=1778671 RepID=A0ABT1WF15_9BURK|nr:YceI family protein [Limnobacter humi]MCQ8896113.1 YceI family protein [Limnobacter humi]